MKFFVEQLLGVIRPVSPLKWQSLVRGIRRTEGWAPPMMLIASLMVMVSINAGFGLLGDFILVRWLNLLAVATWIVVASSATLENLPRHFKCLLLIQ